MTSACCQQWQGELQLQVASCKRCAIVLHHRGETHLPVTVATLRASLHIAPLLSPASCNLQSVYSSWDVFRGINITGRMELGKFTEGTKRYFSSWKWQYIMTRRDGNRPGNTLWIQYDKEGPTCSRSWTEVKHHELMCRQQQKLWFSFQWSWIKEKNLKLSPPSTQSNSMSHLRGKVWYRTEKVGFKLYKRGNIRGEHFLKLTKASQFI